ncbi:NAD(+)--rifampin ADP-ribosyltransferase [Desertifilum sp. FACHB-1129]|nr:MULTISPECIES: NAD(+)--rifampin ADP-ribosyltransferase [unclassified Desertifilum]MBD2311137.1 NAD(+)--rifampin ADP-ribosyltransferase [Desertifilum sp. FACHB-1129]MBD2324004.1 NAD(+)--rifampin ADP-ribosyltransferase [Desertifilum sp. FACHB-866]MBD2333939.1 NAD(+)--rifampin ADP-ribosyltransferase [Desertifilum sp. FACHB-868]MDA0211250.1 NAD(+)--rifampin ADP-ribosyltransferase [Cyanobacteria bacterium FC1]
MATNNPSSQQFYHGTKADLKPGDLIESSNPPATEVYLTPNLDAAIWGAELALGEGRGRVYLVEPMGLIEDAPELADRKAPKHLSMSYCSHEPLRVTGEVTEWKLYHGTRTDLKPGDSIEAGYHSNYGQRQPATYVYLAATLDAAIWGAELALGEGRARIYIVEPTGPIEDDPNVTNQKFPGNPTKSYRSREPLRVTGEVIDWQGHSPEAIEVMKDHLERLKQLGVEAIED